MCCNLVSLSVTNVTTFSHLVFTVEPICSVILFIIAADSATESTVFLEKIGHLAHQLFETHASMQPTKEKHCTAGMMPAVHWPALPVLRHSFQCGAISVALRVHSLNKCCVSSVLAARFLLNCLELVQAVQGKLNRHNLHCIALHSIEGKAAHVALCQIIDLARISQHCGK